MEGQASLAKCPGSRLISTSDPACCRHVPWEVTWAPAPVWDPRLGSKLLAVAGVQEVDERVADLALPFGLDDNGNKENGSTGKRREVWSGTVGRPEPQSDWRAERGQGQATVWESEQPRVGRGAAGLQVAGEEPS